MTHPSAQKRYHSLDSLRAVMMSLGVVLHGAINYVTWPVGPRAVWPFRDPQVDGAFDWIVYTIHLFRMPIFFVVAGFFAAFLYLNRGRRSFVENRAKRIVLPMAIFWPVLFVATTWGFWFAQGQAGMRSAETFSVYAFGRLQRFTFLHLWFLYDLLLLYLAALATGIIPGLERVRSTLDRLFRALMESPLRALPLGVVCGLTLLTMRSGTLDTRTSYVPYPPALLAYGVFFAFGWMLYRNRDLLDRFRRFAWLHVGAGLALTPLSKKLFLEVAAEQPTPDPWIHAGTALASGAAIALYTFGIVGLFLRYCESYSPIGRYLTDASYWIYLVHLPLAVWIPGLLVDAPLSAWGKFLLVEAGITLFVLVTYHYGVRSTFIGQMLNGRRYPRTLPPAMPQVRPAPSLAGGSK